MKSLTKTSLAKVIAATALVAGLTGTAVYAAETTPAPTTEAAAVDTKAAGPRRFVDRMFDRLDPQKTGVVTVEQALARRDKLFDTIDTNKDGSIDKAELTAFYGTRGAGLVDRILKKYDLTNSGKIAKTDFDKPARKRFALLDLNDDGKITKDEAERAMPIPGFDATPRMHHRWTGHGMVGHHRPMMGTDQKPQ
ncbi:MAG: EF-hand domain-containing protein [Ancalomicrobiaceae bacterium]|nr:EF-hand domain-containing protein [Ancalomicrobiaceae bacterium]